MGRPVRNCVADHRSGVRLPRGGSTGNSLYETWPYSSYRDYLCAARSWIDSQPILDLFSSGETYEEFVADYEEAQRERDSVKRELYGR